MTIAELREHLATLDQSMEIMIQGYEYGYCDIRAEQIETLDIKKNENLGHSYAGPHDTAYSNDTGVKVYVIRRYDT